MLVKQPVAPDVYHSHHRDLQRAPTGRNTGEEPVDRAVVRALIYKLVDDAVDTHCARHDDEFGVSRVAAVSLGQVEIDYLKMKWSR